MSSRRYRQQSDSNETAGKVRTIIHDVDDAREAFDDWDDLDSFERWLALRENVFVDVDSLDLDDRDVDRDRAEDLLERTPPTPDVRETSNVTTDGLNEYIVDNLDPNQATNENATHLAVGNDGATGTATTDTTLNNEVYRTATTDTIDNGKDLTTSTFLDSSEANGYTLDEVGLFTDDGTGTNLLLNHATIAGEAKDNTKTLTIDVELQFRSA